MSYAATELNSFYKASRGNASSLSKNKKKNLMQKLLKASPLIILLLIITGFGVLIFAPMAVLPSMLHDKLAEVFDIQWSNNVMDLTTIFGQTLKQGRLDKETTERLKEKNVLVGYEENGSFVETNDHSEGLVLKYRDEIISATTLPGAMEDVGLFDAVVYSSPAFSRAAGYYDETAQKIFKREWCFVCKKDANK